MGCEPDERPRRLQPRCNTAATRARVPCGAAALAVTFGADPPMEFLILGPLEARDGGGRCPSGGAKQRALLALLLLHAERGRLERPAGRRAVGRARRRRPRRRRVQVYVSRLRKALEPTLGRRRVLVTRAPGYVLRVDAGELDLDRFERLVARRAQAAADPPTAARAAARGARAVARAAARRPRLRAVRPGRDRAARGAAAGGARGPDRGRPRARPRTPSSSASSRRSSPSTRCASACAAS